MTSTPAAESRLLAGLRVVDLTDAYGALAGRVFGDLGAEVVRVEPLAGGRGRARAPRAADGTGLHHAFRNAGKGIVTLDPSSADDRATVDRLLDGADVAFVADGWGAPNGFDADALHDRHPDLVVASVSPFGLSGPTAGWQATELVAQSLAGVVYRSGVPELPPVSAPGSYCEDVGAVVAALGAMIALQHGRGGQLVDVSSVLALAQCTEMSLPLWSMIRRDQVRSGAGLYPLFPCTDGLARTVLPMTPRDWRSLIAWLGSPPEWHGPEWDEPMLGEAARAEVLRALTTKFASSTREAITESGEAAGVRVTPVLAPSEVLGNEHVEARGTFVDLPVGAAASGRFMAGIHSVDGVRSAVSGPARPLAEVPVWDPRPAAEPDGRPVGRPLEGIRVLEIGTGVAAPEAARILADWGAEVIKVETRSRPDFQRMVMGGEMNPAFATVARNKLGVAIDLGSEAGRRVLLDLLPSIDVVIENNATGVIDRLGVGWDVLRAANPRLVLVSSQLYGDRGPWARRKGYGPSARAVGGLTWLWAHGPDAPRGVMTIHPDHMAGYLCATGALAGLRRRDATGIGVRIDLAQFEAVIALLGDLFLAESLAEGAAQPAGNGSSEHAPWGLFRCADDEGSESWLAVTVTDDEAWAALVGAAGGAIEDRPEWRHEHGRLADRDAVEAAMAAWLGDRDAGEIEGALQGAGVASGVVVHPRLLTRHPLYVGRGYPTPLEQPGSGPLLMEGSAFTGTHFGTPRCEPAPALGADTAEVLQRLLGLDDEARAALVVAGAIEA